MNPQSPEGRLYPLYAFTAAGKCDPIADDDERADGGVAPMTPEQFNRRLRRIAPARGDRFLGDHHNTCMVIERSKNLNLVLYTANLVDPATEEPVGTGQGRSAVINAKNPLRAYWLKLEPEHVARRRARGEKDDVCELNYIEKKLAYGCSASRLPTGKMTAELRSALKKTDTPLTAEHEGLVAAWDAYFSPCAAKYVAAPHWPVLMLVLPPLSYGEKEDEQADASAITAAKEERASVSSPTQTRADVGGDIGTAPGFSAFDSVPVMLAVIDGELSLLKKVYVTSIEPKHFYQLPSVESLEAFGVSVSTGQNTYEKRMNK